MTHHEFTFTCDPCFDLEILNDILAVELAELGFNSFLSTEKSLQAYINTDEINTDSLDEKLNKFPLPWISIVYTSKQMESKNWNEEWEQNYYKPIKVRKECIIRAPFHDKQEGFKYEILIEPKMSFGTGNHATTYLMLQEMLAQELANKSVLDVGCGTAVLAILAKQMNAAKVVGIDIDEWAYNNACSNAELNDVSLILDKGGAELIKKYGSFDYIFANINRNVLLEDMHHYAMAMSPLSELYMSGFYKEDIPIIEKQCNELGLQILSTIEKDNWAAVRVKRQS